MIVAFIIPERVVSIDRYCNSNITIHMSSHFLFLFSCWGIWLIIWVPLRMWQVMTSEWKVCVHSMHRFIPDCMHLDLVNLHNLLIHLTTLATMLLNYFANFASILGCSTLFFRWVTEAQLSYEFVDALAVLHKNSL